MWRCILLLPIVLVVGGCGQEGPKRYRVSGQVTYDGAPVQAGQVIFEPDAAQGNTGPAGYANIVSGNYQTSPDKGVVGGPHKIRVICLKAAASSELPDGGMLCPEFTVSVDLPKHSTEHDLAVPSTWHW